MKAHVMVAALMLSSCNPAMAGQGDLWLDVHGGVRLELGAAPYGSLGINNTNLYTLSAGMKF